MNVPVKALLIKSKQVIYLEIDNFQMWLLYEVTCIFLLQEKNKENGWNQKLFSMKTTISSTLLIKKKLCMGNVVNHVNEIITTGSL